MTLRRQLRPQSLRAPTRRVEPARLVLARTAPALIVRIHERPLGVSDLTAIPTLILESDDPTLTSTFRRRKIVVGALLREHGQSEVNEAYGAAAEEDVESTARHAYNVSIFWPLTWYKGKKTRQAYKLSDIVAMP
jgi:hypothetical protein